MKNLFKILHEIFLLLKTNLATVLITETITETYLLLLLKQNIKPATSDILTISLLLRENLSQKEVSETSQKSLDLATVLDFM